MTRLGIVCLIGALLTATPVLAKRAPALQCQAGYTLTCVANAPVTPPVTPPPAPPPVTLTCPTRSGYTAAICDNYTTLDTTKWVAQQASTPAAINLSLNNSSNVYGEVEAYLPNQTKMLTGGGIMLQATHQPFTNIGGVGNKQCADNTVQTCSFPWTSAEVNGRGGVVVQPGFVQWTATLRSSANNGPWPALWLFTNDSGRYAEIDVAESFSNDPAHVYMHLHYGNPGSSGNDNSTMFCPMADPTGLDWTTQHTFAVDWNPVAGTITGYIDGTACGTVTAGAKPSESGSSPVWIPNVPLYPIENIAIAPGATGGPYTMDIAQFAALANNAVPAEIVPAYVAGVTTDKASYNPGDTATVTFTVHAGTSAITAGSLQYFLMDFLGDGNGFQQGSTVNGTFPPNTYSYAQIPAIAAGGSYTGALTYVIPASLPAGVYSMIFGQKAAGYARLVVGSPLPPAP